MLLLYTVILGNRAKIIIHKLHKCQYTTYLNPAQKIKNGMELKLDFHETIMCNLLLILKGFFFLGGGVDS